MRPQVVPLGPQARYDPQNVLHGPTLPEAHPTPLSVYGNNATVACPCGRVVVVRSIVWEKGATDADINPNYCTEIEAPRSPSIPASVWP